MLLEAITRTAIGAYFAVYNKFGYGLLERPYVLALEIEMRDSGLKTCREFPIAVFYKGIVVGDYRADLLVERQLIIEVKAAPRIADAHERQLRNYLKSSRLEVGLLFNFGEKPDFRRFIHTNDRKGEWAAERPDRSTDVPTDLP